MAGVHTHRYVGSTCSDTSSGTSITATQPVEIQIGSNWTSVSTGHQPRVAQFVVGLETPLLTVRHLKEVVSGDRKVVFDKGLRLVLTVEWDGGLCVASDERFGLYGSGMSWEEAISDYSDFFVEFFADLSKTPNTELPPSTRKFKSTLLAFGRLT